MVGGPEWENEHHAEVGGCHDALNPADRDVPEIGDEIAVARALVDLGETLLSTATTDIESITHESVALSH